MVRAKIVLLAAEGSTNVEIAARLDTSPQVVWRWRKRFVENRLAGWRIASAQVDPGSFLPSVDAEIKELACELPATTGVPLSRGAAPNWAQALIIRGVVAYHSAATIWRTLRSDAIRPWRLRSWIFPRLCRAGYYAERMGVCPAQEGGGR